MDNNKKIDTELSNYKVSIELTLSEVDMITFSLGQRAESYVALKNRIHDDAVNEFMSKNGDILEEVCDTSKEEELVEANIESYQPEIIINETEDSVPIVHESNEESLVENCGGDFYDDDVKSTKTKSNKKEK